MSGPAHPLPLATPQHVLDTGSVAPFCIKSVLHLGDPFLELCEVGRSVFCAAAAPWMDAPLEPARLVFVLP